MRTWTLSWLDAAALRILRLTSLVQSCMRTQPVRIAVGSSPTTKSRSAFSSAAARAASALSASAVACAAARGGVKESSP